MQEHMKLTFTRILLVITIGLTTVSCDDFLDVNTDTDSPSQSTPNFLLPPILGLYAVNCYEQGETTAYFAQHIATLSGFSAVKDRWDYRNITRVGLFRRHFHDVANNARNLIETAQKEGSGNYEAIGHIMMVLSTQTATDLFGQMPYSEALQGNPSPTYDEQEMIYNGIISEIDIAIDLLSNPDETDRSLTSVEDRVFNGDLNLWLAFAHGLKARLLLHLTPNINQNYQSVIDEANLALAGWGDPQYEYTLGPSQWQMNEWGPSHARPDWDYVPNILDQSAPTNFMLESVLGYDPINHTVDDPRTPLMMTYNVDSQYLSVSPSEGKNILLDDDDYPDLYNTYYTSDDSPIPYMTREELYFISAEMAFQAGDRTAAYDAYQSGIRSHMERVGVLTTEINSFLTNSTLIPQNSADLELSHIMMQKWLALYLQSEAWVDMRRYRYDNTVYVGLQRPTNLAAFWSDSDNTEWIQRLPYDNQTEEIYNQPELERLGAYQNPNWLKVPLWWTGN